MINLVHVQTAVYVDCTYLWHDEIDYHATDSGCSSEKVPSLDPPASLLVGQHNRHSVIEN